LYSLLMVFAKFAVGIWMVIWPEQLPHVGRKRKSNRSSRSGGESRSDIASQAEIPRAPEPPGAQADDPSIAGPSTFPQTKSRPSHLNMSHTRSAFFLGSAMVARGEIALIVAQLARPLLASTSDKNGGASSSESEPFAVVIWAILVSTVGGAIGVGLVLRTRTATDVARQ
jgi:hypothetical protein